MKSIILIIPYFGKWPIWFDAYLLSIANNPTIHWLCPTDCLIPEDFPDNITFIPMTLKECNQRINQSLELIVPLNTRKFCDLKPAYGVIFNDEIKEYDFWGFCDIDIIWGDIRKYITKSILTNYDVITSRKQKIAGHFTILKNAPALNRLFEQIPGIDYLYQDEKHHWVDEKAFTKLLGTNSTKFQPRVYWPQYLVNNKKGRAHQEYYLDRWKVESGKLYEIINGVKMEHMYLHFINWKKTMTKCELEYKNSVRNFYISYDGIHLNKHGRIKKIFNSIKNLFNGYHAKNNRWAIISRIKNNIKKF